jgi:hypothetical protein
MEARLFTVFHRAVDLRQIFPFFSSEEISTLVTLYAVAERYPEKWVILKDGRRIAAKEAPGSVFEQDLRYYDPQLQVRGFMETSAYVHILKNDLHVPYDHIGISQYDMRWTREGVARLREITTAQSPTVGAVILGKLMDGTGALHRLAFPRNFNWDFLLASYNRHFGTAWDLRALAELPLTLFQTYVLPRAEFAALVGWLEKLCDEVWPWANQPPYQTHWGVLGGYTERAEALFIALGFREGRFRLRHLPLEHDKNIPIQLGITKEHYG